MFDNEKVRDSTMVALQTAAISLTLIVASSALTHGQTVLSLTTTGPGSVTIPAGYVWTNVTVQCWGGGGGGGSGRPSTDFGAGGGGGGAYSSNTYITPFVAGSYSYYVGTGGTGGPDNAYGSYGPGSSGGNTIWNYGGAQDIMAGGGGGGTAAEPGGMGGGGGLVLAGTGFSGGAGGYGPGAAYGGGGGGSGGLDEPGGQGGAGTTDENGGGSSGAGYGPGGTGGFDGIGGSGSFPGGGGGGGGNNSGGQGANGEIIITYTPEPSSTLSLSASTVTLRAMRNSGTTAAVTLSETSGFGVGGFSSSVSGAATVNPSSGTVAAGGTQSLSLGWSDYTTTGPRADTVTLNNTSNAADPFNSAGNVIAMTGAVVDNRVVTTTTVNFGLVHVGAAMSQPVTLSTTGDDNHFTRVTVGNAGPDTNGISVTGGTNPVFNDSSVTDQRTLGGILGTAGAVNGSIMLPTTGEWLAGESPVSVPVNYTAQVYSGQAEWNSSTGQWGTSANWKDAAKFGGGPSGVPGLSGYATDTATFGRTIPNGIAAVALDGVAPVLSNIIFDNPNASYFILQGVGSTGLALTGTAGISPAALTVVSGSHRIYAPILLDSNLLVSDSGSLALAANISDGGLANSLTLNGGGALTLSGSNSYSGGTTVLAGSLALDGASALLAGSSLTIGAAPGQGAIFDTSPAAGNSSSVHDLAPVPEPGTLALLGVSTLLFMVYSMGCRKKAGKR